MLTQKVGNYNPFAYSKIDPLVNRLNSFLPRTRRTVKTISYLHVAISQWPSSIYTFPQLDFITISSSSAFSSLLPSSRRPA